LAKLVDFECPRCGIQTRVPTGMRDVHTGEIIGIICPKCGLEFEFEAQPLVSVTAK